MKLGNYLTNLRNWWYNIKIIETTAIFNYKKRKLFIQGGNIDCWEIFGKEVYKNLNVKNKRVIDVGASVGDTAIYFSINGAKDIWAFEIEPKRIRQMSNNLAFNEINNVKIKPTMINYPSDLYDYIEHNNTVLKMDIEGGEYKFFENIKPNELRNYEEIILEYHNGFDLIATKLREANFRYWITHISLINPKMGILHAKKEKDVELITEKSIEEKGIPKELIV